MGEAEANALAYFVAASVAEKKKFYDDDNFLQKGSTLSTPLETIQIHHCSSGSYKNFYYRVLQ